MEKQFEWYHELISISSWNAWLFMDESVDHVIPWCQGSAFTWSRWVTMHLRISLAHPNIDRWHAGLLRNLRFVGEYNVLNDKKWLKKWHLQVFDIVWQVLAVSNSGLDKNGDGQLDSYELRGRREWSCDASDSPFSWLGHWHRPLENYGICCDYPHHHFGHISIIESIGGS